MKKKSIFCNIKKYLKPRDYFKSGMRVFSYHRIKPPDKAELLFGDALGDPFCVDPKLFEKQIKAIRNNYKIISSDDFIQGNISKNCALITFDDGYKDFYTNAFPILIKYKTPATIFLITDFIGTKKAFWWDEITNIILNTKIKSFDKFSLIDYENKAKFLSHVLLKCNEINEGEKEHYIKTIKEHLGDGEIEGNNLYWDDIILMKEYGISIGSHTMSHPVLTNTIPLKAKEEILNSKIMIEENIKEGVKAFAYPHGIYNKEIRNMVEFSGYKCAFTSINKMNYLGDDLFEMGRSFAIHIDRK